MITRTIMIENTAKNLKVTQKLTRAIVKDFLRQINGALLNGEVVWIRHLGMFKVVYCKPRKAMNVKTGIPVYVPAKKRIRFKPCSLMKEKVNA